MLNDSPECRSGCQNEEKDFFEPLCLRARNGFIGSCSTTLQSVGVAVKNDNEVFFVPLCLSARNGPAMTGRFCTAVSKMRETGVQNVRMAFDRMLTGKLKFFNCYSLIHRVLIVY